jgi:ATP-dependent DNA helicase RecG
VRLLSLLDDEQLIAEARAEATALVEHGGGLADHPELAAAVAALALDDRADYLEKA